MSTDPSNAASKHALQGFCDSLRMELAPKGVHVLVVSPGFVATEFRARAAGPDGAPLGTSPRDEARGTMPIEVVAREVLASLQARARELVLPRRMRWGQLAKVVAPNLVDRIPRRVMREKVG